MAGVSSSEPLAANGHSGDDANDDDLLQRFVDLKFSSCSSSSAAADAAPLSPPLTLTAAAHNAAAAAAAASAAAADAADDDDADNNDNNNNNFSPLLGLVERFPDLFERKVLRRMDPIDRTFLAQTGRACRAVAAASDLPRAGTREEVLEGRSVWVVTHKLREFCTSVERLAWAKASGCPWVSLTCALAARGGRLHVLRWAREHGSPCPWDAYTCACAARGGHLEVLKWAREHGQGLHSSTSQLNLSRFCH